jgi:hypothetical protein
MLDIERLAPQNAASYLGARAPVAIAAEFPFDVAACKQAEMLTRRPAGVGKEAITMRSVVKTLTFFLVSAVAVGCVAPIFAQQIRYEDFSSIANLQLNGNSHKATWQGQQVLRLTDGPLVGGGNPQTATTYSTYKQQVASGFTSWIEFQMHNPTNCCTPGDGVALVIQNSNATDGSMGASGAGITALGAGMGGVGYAGINNSLAIEFDIYQDPWDPTSNHVAVQSCGQNFNSPVHLPGDYTIGNNHHVESCLLFQSQQAIYTPTALIGPFCPGVSICGNGPVNQVVIEYTAPQGQGSGTLNIWLNPPLISGTHTPKPGTPPNISLAYTINDPNYGLALDHTGCNQVGKNCGYAWVGLTASQPTNGTAQDILQWEFTPHNIQVIKKVIENGGIPTTFPFGAHEADVTYPTGFQNVNNISMIVQATPWDPNVFFKQRLLGTQFANETCVTYLQTGGQCIVYSVTCQDQNKNPVTCPQEPTCSPQQLADCIDIDSSFTTNDPITPSNADFLEAEPIGSNNWFSIFFSYNPNLYDGVISGKGKGFSDIVATFQRNKH